MSILKNSRFFSKKNDVFRHTILRSENLEDRCLLAVSAGWESSGLEAAGLSASAVIAEADQADTDFIRVSTSAAGNEVHGFGTEEPSTVVTTLLDTVDKTDDLISLREAVLYAEEGDIITFDSSLAGGTIVLNGTELSISKSMTIDASDVGGIAVDAGGKSRCFSISAEDPSSEMAVAFVQLTITGGKSGSYGGGIYAENTSLVLINSVLTGNSAEDEGSAVLFNGYNKCLSMTNCTVSDNSLHCEEYGYNGTIALFSGYANLTDTVISHNNGAGIFASDSLVLLGCEISNNTNGGINGSNGGELTLNDTVISNNGSLSSWCGGINFYTMSFTAVNSTITQNTSVNAGGGICIYADSAYLENTLIADNTAYGESSIGGGIFSMWGELSLFNCTVAGNSAYEAGGIYASCGNVYLYNSIVAENSADDIGCYVSEDEDSGSAAVNGYYTISTFTDWTDSESVILYDSAKPLFFDLENSDYTLSDTSLAINAGCNDYVLSETDIAGNSRIIGGTVDLGAYESPFAARKLTAPSNLSIAEKTGSKSITISWDSVEDASSYLFAYSIAGGDFKTVEVTKTSSSFSVLPEKKYEFKVMALSPEESGCLDSDYSESVFYPTETRSTVVTTLLDVVDETDDLISLREAISYAEEGEEVTFDSSLAGGTISLGGTELYIDKSITIDASDVSSMTVDAGGASRCFFIEGDSSSETAVKFVNLTITGGYTDDCGGGIYAVSVSLDLTDTVISGNDGTGICSFGDLSLSSCEVSMNNGGGIFGSTAGYLTLTDTVISDNYTTAEGGGIFFASGMFQMDNCIVSRNNSAFGGGIYISASEPISIQNSIIANNSASDAAGLFMSAPSALLVNVLVSDNGTVEEGSAGGGILWAGGTLELFNSTVAGNTASAGAGIYADSGTVSLYNSIAAENNLKDIDYYKGSEDDEPASVYGYYSLSSFTDWTESESVLLYDSAKPLFTDRESGDYTLAKQSQAINAGCNDYVLLDTDLAGNPRIFGENVDLGAYESMVLPKKEITDVSLYGWEGFYDGDFHTVTLVDQYADTDTILYKYDGRISIDPPLFSEVGVYTVQVTVSRAGYYDWTGSADVVIELPAVSTKITVTTEIPVIEESDDPESVTQVFLGERFYVSVWVKSQIPGYGVEGGYCSLYYSESVAPGQYFCSSFFPEDTAAGLDDCHITGFGGNASEMGVGYGDGIWVLAGTHSFTAAEIGTISFFNDVATKNGVEKPAWNFILSSGEMTNAYDSVSVNVVADLETPEITTGSQGIFVSYGANRHLIQWNEVEGAAGYELQYSANGSMWKSIKVDSASAVVTGLTYGTNQQYRVRAFLEGEISYSDWSEIKIFNVCPADINNDGDIASADRNLLGQSWMTEEGEEGYQYYCDIDGDGDIAGGDRNFISINWLKTVGEDEIVYPRPISADLLFEDFGSIDTAFEDFFGEI